LNRVDVRGQHADIVTNELCAIEVIAIATVIQSNLASSNGTFSHLEASRKYTLPNIRCQDYHATVSESRAGKIIERISHCPISQPRTRKGIGGATDFNSFKSAATTIGFREVNTHAVRAAVAVPDNRERIGRNLHRSACLDAVEEPRSAQIGKCVNGKCIGDAIYSGTELNDSWRWLVAD
jgi:hypothetical protein